MCGGNRDVEALMATALARPPLSRVCTSSAIASTCAPDRFRDDDHNAHGEGDDGDQSARTAAIAARTAGCADADGNKEEEDVVNDGCVAERVDSDDDDDDDNDDDDDDNGEEDEVSRRRGAAAA